MWPDLQLGEKTELFRISVAGFVTEDVANSTLGYRIKVHIADLEFGCNLPLYTVNHSQAGAQLDFDVPTQQSPTADNLSQ